MTNIFLFVKPANVYAQRELQWISVSHVSTRWRNTALNSVALWTRPPFGPWASGMIKRSKVASLSIHFDFGISRHRLNQALSLLEQALARDGCVKELDFFNVPFSQQHFVNALATRLPRLEKLYISGCSSSFNSHERQLLVPGSIFSGTRKLRQLDLLYCRTG